MKIVVFFALLFVLTLIIYWFKRRKMDVGFILLALYTLVAILGVPFYISTENQWKITLWPYLYLFVVLVLFFRPFFFDSDSLVLQFYNKNDRILKIISTLYIFCAGIAIYYSLPQAIVNLESGQWVIIRNQLYAGEIFLYSTQIERFAKIFIQYFDLAVIIIFYYFLTLKNIKSFWKILLPIAIFFPSLITSIIIASRGRLFYLLINFFLVYIIFKNNIPPNLKKALKISAISLLIVLSIYSLAITASRFGQENQSSSLLYYFAHSFLTFNYGIADSIHEFANGRYFFSWFFDLFGKNSEINYNQLGTHSGTAFITFVGTLYIDFGPIGTFLIALLIPFLIKRSFRHKKNIDIADMYIYVFYLSYVANGVFVVGLGNSLSWLMAILIYIILKFSNYQFKFR